YAEVRTERTRVLDMVWRGGAVDSVVLYRDEGRCARVIGPTGASFAASTTEDGASLVRLAKRGAGHVGLPGGPLADAPPADPVVDAELPEAVELVPLEEKAALLGGYYDSAL